MWIFFLRISILLCFIASTCQGSKILFFFGGGSYSHKASAYPWASELSNRGHEVIFLSPHEKKPADNSKIRDLSSKALNKLMGQAYDIDRFTERKLGKEFTSFYNPMSIKICQTLLQSNDDAVLQPLINNITFDLVVVNVLFGECGFLLANHYQAKTISYDACTVLPWFYDTHGFLPETSWVPDLISSFQNFPLSYMERLFNAFQPLFGYWDRCNNLFPQLEELMKETFNLKEVPSVLELERNTSLVFVNSHPAMDFAYTLPPFIKMIGGIQTGLPEKPIPEKYQDFMDASGSKGVILISFGSTVDLEKVPVFYQNIFFNLVKKYDDVRFLMKWNGSFPEGFETGLKNLMVTDWLPQRELLRHPKLRAFVTHGGLNSIQEATYYGVPLVALPLFADQDYNAYRIDAQEVGFRLEIRDLDFEIMDKAINRILNNPKYKKNMERKSKMFRDRPQSPLEKAIYWTEFVLRHDDMSALKPMSITHPTWFQLRNLDVYFFALTILVLSSLLMLLILTKLAKILFPDPEQSNRIKTKVN